MRISYNSLPDGENGSIVRYEHCYMYCNYAIRPESLFIQQAISWINENMKSEVSFVVNVQGNSQKLNKKHFIAGVCQKMQRY